MAERGDKAREDAAGVAELKAQLAGASDEYKRLKAEAQQDLFARNPLAKAKHDVEQLTAKLRMLAEAKREAEGVKVSGALGGDKTLAKAGEALDKSFTHGEGSATAIEGALSKGGSALQTGAMVAVGAAAAIGAAGLALVKSGIEFGVRSTADKDKQVQILDRLTKGQGALAEEVSQGLAEATGVGEERTLDRVKGLIAAKFGRGDTEDIVRAAADVGAVKGEGAGEAFVDLLEKTKALGAASERSIKGLASVGIEKSELFEGLKKTGETVEGVEARLKAGKVTADEFTHAAVAAAKKDFGGVAGKGLDAQINRLKIGLGDLFEDWDLSPIEELGNKLEDVLKGEGGDELKKAFSEGASEILGLLKHVSKQDVKNFFADAAFAAKEFTHGVTASIEAVGKLGKALGINQVTKSETSTGDVGKGQEEIVHQKRTIIPGLWYEETSIPKAELDAAAIGKAIDDGIAKGVDDNAKAPADATARAAKGAVDAGNKAIGARSPSVEAGKTGMYYDQGLERGIDAHAGLPERAAARTAARLLGAGRAVGGGSPFDLGGGAGGAAGARPSVVLQVTFAPVISLPPGSTAETEAAAERGVRAAYPDALVTLRNAARDAMEMT